MAQTRYLEYLADDLSFSINAFLNGILPEGRYRGFDFEATNDLFLNLTHNTTGFRFAKADGTLTPLSGVLRTKQGVVVVEDATIVLPVSSNLSGNPRIDLVVCEHQYQVDTAEGFDAEYFIIEGTPSATPVEPTLTNPNFQTVIGKLTLPNGTTTLDGAGVIYEQLNIPELGNNDIQEQLNLFITDITNQFNVLQGNFDTLQDNFDQLNQDMIDWRAYYIPQMQYDGVNIEWKYAGEADDPLVWRDLAQAIVVNCAGPGTMEVRVLEPQYLPVPELWDAANPMQRDHNVLEFNTQTSLPNGTNWINNREWVAPQTKDYRFLLDTLYLECTTTVDYDAIHLTNDSMPFAINGTNKWLPIEYDASGGIIFDFIEAGDKNFFMRVELVKNGTVIYTQFHKYGITDGVTAGTKFLFPVIDINVSAQAGDNFHWRISTLPNYQVQAELTPEEPYSVFNYFTNLFPAVNTDIIKYRYGNSQHVINNHFAITEAHWTVSDV